MKTPLHHRACQFRSAALAALQGLLCFYTLSGGVLAETKIEDVPGQSTFTLKDRIGTDFSGLTWLGGDGYYAVSNRAKAMFPLFITLEPATGRIADARFGKKIPVKTDYDDLEGIAWIPELQRIYLSSESKNGIVGFDQQGDATFAVEVPAIFQQARRNKSLESLTYGAGFLWTANEDALACDGPLSSATSGALVRIQKFDSRFRPAGQFAYRTDTSLLRAKGGGTGVSDLCALPNGELLSLERVVGAGLVVKIFLLDFQGATDTAKLPSLAGADITLVRKTLLYERHTFTTNFEGITLGPPLAEGWRSLLLISDSGGDPEHELLPLRIHFDAPVTKKRK